MKLKKRKYRKYKSIYSLKIRKEEETPILVKKEQAFFEKEEMLEEFHRLGIPAREAGREGYLDFYWKEKVYEAKIKTLRSKEEEIVLDIEKEEKKSFQYIRSLEEDEKASVAVVENDGKYLPAWCWHYQRNMLSPWKEPFVEGASELQLFPRDCKFVLSLKEEEEVLEKEEEKALTPEEFSIFWEEVKLNFAAREEEELMYEIDICLNGKSYLLEEPRREWTRRCFLSIEDQIRFLPQNRGKLSCKIHRVLAKKPLKRLPSLEELKHCLLAGDSFRRQVLVMNLEAELKLIPASNSLWEFYPLHLDCFPSFTNAVGEYCLEREGYLEKIYEELEKVATPLL